MNAIQGELGYDTFRLKNVFLGGSLNGKTTPDWYPNAH